MVDRTGSVAGTVRDYSGYAGTVRDYSGYAGTVFWLQERTAETVPCGGNLPDQLSGRSVGRDGGDTVFSPGGNQYRRPVFAELHLAERKDRRKADSLYFNRFDYSAGLSVQLSPV